MKRFNNPIAEAATVLSGRIKCFSREGTALILVWLDTKNIKTFRPRDLEEALEDVDPRTIGASLKSLGAFGFVKKGDIMPEDGRAHLYTVDLNLVRTIKALIKIQ